MTSVCGSPSSSTSPSPVSPTSALKRSATTSAGDSISRLEGYRGSSYQSRMANRSVLPTITITTGAASSSSSSLSFSSPSSPQSSSRSPSVSVSRRGSSNRSASSPNAVSPEPVVRGGFVIPAITLTPPDSRHKRCEALPWQDFTSKTTLYVPVKTEEIGWEEGGLWWCGQYQYREVALYGGEDDHVVGKYRGGPEGHCYMDVWDQEAFEATEAGPPRKNGEPAPQKSGHTNTNTNTNTSSGSGSSSSSRSISNGDGRTHSNHHHHHHHHDDKGKGKEGDSVSSFSSSCNIQSATPPPNTTPTTTTPPPAASPATGTAFTPSPEVSLSPPSDTSGTPSTSRRSSESSCPSLSSTPSSSRRCSDFTTADDDDDDDGDNDDDVLRTPSDSPLRGTSLSQSDLIPTPPSTIFPTTQGKAVVSRSPTSIIDPSGPRKLEAALWALKAEKKAKEEKGDLLENEEVEDLQAHLDISSSSSSSSTPRPAHSSDFSSSQQILKFGKSLLLSEDGPSASHHWPKGRGVARIASYPRRP